MNIYIPLKTIINQNNFIEMCRIQTKSQRHHQEQAVRTQGPSISTSIQYLLRRLHRTSPTSRRMR